MTEQDARHEEDLWARPEDDNDDQTGWDDAAWDEYVSSKYHPRPADSPRSAQRASRLLLSIIVVATAALVVAVAVLVSGNFAGRIPTSPQLATPTSEPEPVAPTNSTIPGGKSPSSSSSDVPSPVRTTEPESASETPQPVPAAPEPASSEPAAPSPTAPSPTAGSPERKPASGPRINVTRTPMSFTPGIRGN